jgi:hypothetical protein
LIPLGFRPVCAQSPVDESRLKAAFLYRFAQFVEWPPVATASTASVNLCITGPRVSRDFLAELVAGETLAGKPLAVHDATSDNVTACHLLFLHADAGPRGTLLRKVGDRPVLTVSDAPRFLDEGGIVLLRVVDNRVRFEIDAEAARRANLRLNTQLLKLAANVRGGAAR